MTSENGRALPGVLPLIPQHDALRLQLAMVGGNEPPTSCFEIRGLKHGVVLARRFIRTYSIRRAMQEIERLAATVDVFIGCAPRTGYTSGTLHDIERVWCLWTDCDTPEASVMLRRFRPRPSLVVGSGGPDRHHAYWQLNQPLSTAGADRANRRLAKALGADSCCDATRVLRPIGSVNHKHGTAVRCVHLDPVAFHPADVVGGLEDDGRCSRPSGKPTRHRRAAGTDGLVNAVAGAENGNRNRTLYWAAMRAVEEGTFDEVHDQLQDAALATGLEPANVRSTLNSAQRHAA
jgi:hypothetical protein